MKDRTAKFQRGNVEYGITLRWNEEQLGEGEIDCEYIVFRQPLTDDGRAEGERFQVSSHVKVAIDEEKGAVLTIEIADKEIFSLPLTQLVDEETVVAQALESVHSSFYGGDPIIGCLIRSGCSVAVGQIIKCKNSTFGHEWVKDRLLAIARCLRSHIRDMAVLTAMRAAKCVFRFGF